MNVATANQSKSRVAEPARDYVTATIAGQLFGIPVLSVQDVLGAQRLTRIPLAQIGRASCRERV